MCQALTQSGQLCTKPCYENLEFCYIHRKQAEKPTCSICIEEIETSAVKKLTCGHKFCLSCISKIRKLKCPYCRAPIENLSEYIEEMIEQREYNDEHERLAEERRNLQEEFQRARSRPDFEDEIKAALVYLSEQGIPRRFLPENIDIGIFNDPRNPPPPPGIIFTAIIGTVLERVRQAISEAESDDDEDSGSEIFSDEEELSSVFEQ